jgi:hypothetical protein
MQDDDLTFRVDRIDLTEVEIRVARVDRTMWRWQVLYVGSVQVQGWTHESEADAWHRAQQHRDVWIEQELEAIRRLPADDDTETP